MDQALSGVQMAANAVKERKVVLVKAIHQMKVTMQMWRAYLSVYYAQAPVESLQHLCRGSDDMKSYLDFNESIYSIFFAVQR